MIELTEKQRLIVETTKPSVVVVASAAAGKTRCITERVRWLLNQGVAPEKIAAITFTNAAAEEISERLGNPEKVFIGTIHSLANYFLRMGGVDTSQILNEEKFDELFTYIKKNPHCIQKIEHLIVDEAQDSNPEQFEFLLDMIMPDNFMLMGDHRQSIYRWNGAEPDYILNLMENPEVQVYDLDENFRNAPEILEYARNLIRPAGYEYLDHSIAMRKVHGAVVDVEYSGFGIARTIKQRIESGRDKYKDWFILTRSNAQSDEMIAHLKKMNIPCDTFKKSNLDNKGLNEKMKEDTVKVLTIHTAKGLEAKNVVVIGAQFRSLEERCIAYVAATRARDLLVWTRSPKKHKPSATMWST